VPANPKAGSDGIVVCCQVLEWEPPSRLAYSWPVGPIIDTQVIDRLEPDGDGTRVFFEHFGLDMSSIGAGSCTLAARTRHSPNCPRHGRI
jgi:hypothetical protein